MTEDELDLLPGCILTVTQETITANSYEFTDTQPPDTSCCFSYLKQIVRVALGFEATDTGLNSYDRGIDSDGKAN